MSVRHVEAGVPSTVSPFASCLPVVYFVGTGPRVARVKSRISRQKRYRRWIGHGKKKKHEEAGQRGGDQKEPRDEQAGMAERTPQKYDEAVADKRRIGARLLRERAFSFDKQNNLVSSWSSVRLIKPDRAVGNALRRAADQCSPRDNARSLRR